MIRRSGSRLTLILAAVAVLLAAVASAEALPAPFFNGFEAEESEPSVFGVLFESSRVPSGTRGIPSAEGAWHSEVRHTSPGLDTPGQLGAASDWGASNREFPEAGFSTSIDVYFDAGSVGGLGRSFVFTSALFAAGDRSDPMPGSGVPVEFSVRVETDPEDPGRFLVSAGRDCLGLASGLGELPQVIEHGPGWYSLRHTFAVDSGFLWVGLEILASDGEQVARWEFASSSEEGGQVRSDLAGSQVGGPRYGWFCDSSFDSLAVDNVARFAHLPKGPESPRARKRFVTDAVSSLLPSGRRGRDIAIRSVADGLGDSVDSRHWRDDDHLDASSGWRFFLDEEHIVGEVLDEVSGLEAPYRAYLLESLAAWLMAGVDLLTGGIEEVDRQLQSADCSDSGRDRNCEKRSGQLEKTRRGVLEAEQAVEDRQYARAARQLREAWKSLDMAWNPVKHESDEASAQLALASAIEELEAGGCGGTSEPPGCKRAWKDLATAEESFGKALEAMVSGDRSRAAKHFETVEKQCQRAIEALLSPGREGKRRG